jgi:predicted solute-binding protein
MPLSHFVLGPPVPMGGNFLLEFFWRIVQLFSVHTSQETENMLALFDGPLLILDHALIHADHLQGQLGNMWKTSATCQMIMAIIKW